MTGVAAEVGSTANHYQILGRLAVGGMAEIFLARGVSTTGVERYCVLKRILRERANDVHFVRMFLDEARLAAQLQHPNVAQVYDIGKLGDSFFFTMEYVHGETVRQILHRARSLRREVPPGAVLTVIAGAAAGLHHAHGRLGHDGRPLGIVHRDVSPSNLMVSYEGGTKVVDFGVAKAENRAQETRSGTVKGKIAYLSPEQCRGGALDRRSDLFSLGIVMWEMLTTERLYKRASDFENMSAIVNEEPVPPSARRKSVPKELDRITLRLLAKDPDARFQSGDELVEALEEVASKTGIMISSGALGRFLREMFGQRPEPWLELDPTAEAPSEAGVTVTSEPIPQELAISAADSADLKLSGVPDISGLAVLPSGPLDPSDGPAASSQMVTAAGKPTPQRELAALRGLPLVAPPSGIAPLDPALRASSPSAAPPSGPHTFGAAGSYSGSGSDALILSGSHSAHAMIPQPREARSWPLVAIVASAAIIGSLTVWLVMRSSSHGATVRDAEVAAVSTGAIDAGDTREAPRDATMLAVAVAVLDAAPLHADASEPADATPPDAARPVRDAIAVAMEDSRYDDVIAICAAGMQPEHTASCTLAACHMHQDVKARGWYGKLATGRRAIASACRALGVELVPRARPATKGTDAGVSDPCLTDPRACQ